MSDTVTLRPATMADDRFLRAVFADNEAHFALLGPDVREILLDMAYREHRSSQLAEYPDVERFVVVAGGADVGSLAYDMSSGVIEILELVISRPRRRHGIGSAVLGMVPVGPKATTVRTRDVAARSLYTRHGFTVSGQTRSRLTLRAAA